MAEELQSLLEKIQRDGIDKAAAEREEIIKKAQAEAESIVAAAKENAEKIRNDAARDAEALTKRAESAVRQAARDILLELNSELKKRVENIVRKRTDEALSSDFMAEIIREVAKSVLNGQNADTNNIEVMVSPAKCEELVAKLAASACQDMVEKISVFPNSAAGRGLKISVNGDQVFFDFSDAALTGMVCSYAGSRVSAVITAQD
jgi:vacuolar-type H+-ATPase subunit E/Vma4